MDNELIEKLEHVLKMNSDVMTSTSVEYTKQVISGIESAIDNANKEGYNSAVNDIVDFSESMPVDAETIREQFLCV